MQNRASLQPRDIVTVRQQVIEGQQIKNRMWIVISKNILHQNSNGCILLGITTIPSRNYTMIPITADDLEHGRLDKPNESQVVVDKPVWTKLSEINGIIGKVSSNFFGVLKNKIKQDILEI